VVDVVLGLQGGIANGSEATFDGQPMQPGVHLRWGFSPELGFPPGGFWLCRRIANEGENGIPPPQFAGQMPAGEPTNSNPADGGGQPGTVSQLPGTNQWLAETPGPCQSVLLAGCAAPGCEQIEIETFTRNADGKLEVTGSRIVRVEQGCFRIRIAAREISCVRVAGAGSVDECGCDSVLPPADCSCGGNQGGGGANGGGNPPAGGQPGWGDPGENGWQCWGVPFTLPLTQQNWPARYYGAPDPLTMLDSQVADLDVKEAIRRLGALNLAAGLSTAQQAMELRKLRNELKRMVEGFPSTLLADVPLNDSPAGKNAPALNLSLMQQLLLLALDPYFAHVMGLYFVDEDAAPDLEYDYCVTGYWGSTPCQAQILYPGLAPAASLSKGSAVFNGMTILPQGGYTSLWRWLRDDINGNYDPRTDPVAPPAVAFAASIALGGLPSNQQPSALLALFSSAAGLFPFFAPAPTASIAFAYPMPRVDVDVSGVGTVQAFSGGVLVASAPFNNGLLATVTANATTPDQLIDTIQITGQTAPSVIGLVVMIGEIVLHRLSPDAIGTRYSMLNPPATLTQLAAPGQPASTFIHRQADVDTTALTLVPHTLIHVEWPAPLTMPTTGDPVSDPLGLPPPTLPIGFVAERQDSGKTSSEALLPNWIAAASSPTPSSSKITTPRLYRLADSGLGDPEGGWSHRVAGFDIFGALGVWTGWTPPLGVEKIAAAPTNLRIVQFDNTPAAGGAAAADGSAWVGGTLNFAINWSGAAFVMYPDIETARITVDGLDIATGSVTGPLATQDVPLPPRTVQAFTVTSVVAAPTADGTSYLVDIQTHPPLPALGPRDPAALLMLTLPDGSIERYGTRPSALASAGPVVARLQAGVNSRVVTNCNAYVAQPAYLIPGYGMQRTIDVPLSIPLDETTARACISVIGSTKNPFNATERIVDPNGLNPPRTEPQSVALAFTGVQRLTPSAPPTPVHDVDHVYYDPADSTGQAGKTLPFDTSAGTGSGTGIQGYVLQRAPVRSLILADIKRRIALGNAALNDPQVDEAGNVMTADGGASAGPQRPDLVAWIGAFGQWLSSYNALTGTSWTMANVWDDATAQRALIEHFYGGLLDDELRALGDIVQNSAAFVRVNPQPLAAGQSIYDSVDGTGYGRTLYKLAVVNTAGTLSSVTGSIGPYYTQIVTPPRPPVLYKVQAAESAIVVAWSLDTNPDVAAYLVYRAGSVDALSDLRWFGPDPTHPVNPGTLAQIAYNPQTMPSLSFGVGTLDPRIVGFVPDPRLCARDYTGSDMGEVALPVGPAPDSVIGVYRLTEYQNTRDPLSQIAFNYWTPPSVGGIAQVKSSSLTQSRLTGLRIGLGRAVPVVVVATYPGGVKVFGQITLRRSGFIDGITAGGEPLDMNAIPGAAAPATDALYAYAVVAADIFGNLSSPSKVFAMQMLAKASGS
jgi:hypothetical protein